MVPEACDDPCESIPLNPRRERQRFLTDSEFTRLGQVLDEVQGNASKSLAGKESFIFIALRVYG